MKCFIFYTDRFCLFHFCSAPCFCCCPFLAQQPQLGSPVRTTGFAAAPVCLAGLWHEDTHLQLYMHRASMVWMAPEQLGLLWGAASSS